MIKVGDILKMNNEDRNETVKVLAILGELYAISNIFDHSEFGAWNTKKQLESNFDLPKEKWRPDDQAEYWYVGSDGDIGRSIFKGIFYGEMRCKFGNCFATCTEAELARDKIREVLKQ